MKTWENNYKNLKRYNNYPHDFVVSETLKHFKNVNKIKALDLGCGGGGNTKFLAEQGFLTYGVDASQTAVNLTKKKLVKSKKKKLLKQTLKIYHLKKTFLI